MHHRTQITLPSNPRHTQVETVDQLGAIANSVTQLQTPFANLLPPLTTDEFAALKADIKAHGVLHPISIDEDGNILDGHHRFKIRPDAPRKLIRGLSEGEKQAFVFRSNFTRRNLSPAQKEEARRQMKQIAANFRNSEPKRWTQANVASLFGVARETVRDWFSSNGHNGGSANMSHPDARIKIQPKARSGIVSDHDNGKSVAQIAADFGVSTKHIHRIIAQGKTDQSKREERETAALKIQSNVGIFHLDFRDADLADESVDLVFTDPPYGADAVPLYADLGKFANRVLRPGGWLLCYAGQAYLDRVFKVLGESGLTYGWTCSVQHSSGSTQFHPLKIRIGWKPVIAWYKPKLNVTWEYFSDVCSGGREKGNHEWQQAEAEAIHFIKHLCPRNGTVCDPFAGSGTSLAAAKQCGLRWIGYETDEHHVETARIRLNQ